MYVHSAIRAGIGSFLLFTALPVMGDISPTDSSAMRRFALPEAVVNGRKIRKDITSSTPRQTLDASEFRTQGITSIAEALNSLSGITLRDYGGAGGLKTVSVRGLGAAHTGVTYDGVSLSDVQNGQIDLSRYQIDALSQLTLEVGDGAELLLPARTVASPATLNLCSAMMDPTDNEPHFTVGFTQGSFDNYRSFLHFGKQMHKLLLTATADYRYGENRYPYDLINGRYKTSEKRSNSRMSAFQGEANGLYRFGNSSEWETKVYYYDNARHLPGQVVYYNTDGHERLHEQNAFAQTRLRTGNERLRWLFTGKYDFNASRYSDFGGAYENGALHQNYYRREAYASAAGLYAFPSIGMELTYAADYAYQGLHSNLDTDADVWRHSLWQTLGAEWKRRLLSAKVRLLYSLFRNGANDGQRARNADRLSPSASLTLRLPVGVPLYLRTFYKDIFRMPTFTENYYFHYGNKNLLPERTHQFGLGLTTSFRPAKWWQELSVSVDGYLNRVKNKIISVPYNLFVFRTFNLAKVDVKGVDVNLRATFAPIKHHRFILATNYTFQQVENVTNSDDPYNRLQLAYTPRHSGGASLAWENPWVNIVVRVSASSERFSTNEHLAGTDLKAYQDWGAGLYRTLHFGRTKCDVRFDVKNLFGKQYEIIRLYPMPKRAYEVSIIFDI